MSLYLVDTSAWHRAPLIADTWAQRLGGNTLATCAQTRLEILFSARSGVAYEQLAVELIGLRSLPCGELQFDRALEVQLQLARKGGLHHRSVQISDLIIAASAEDADAIVWHYDEDFDRITEITGQPMEWIAPRGSLR